MTIGRAGKYVVKTVLLLDTSLGMVQRDNTQQMQSRNRRWFHNSQSDRGISMRLRPLVIPRDAQTTEQ